MPIKFRCEHCRQFLGISHNKAGTLVDCPTCGRTIRVPDPEGVVQPLPELQLNLKDSKLATALEELASLGRDDSAGTHAGESVVEISEGQLPPPPDAAARPLAAPAPIRVDPVAPPKPIPIAKHDLHNPAPIASMKELSALANSPTTRDPAAEQPVVDVEMPLGLRPLERIPAKRVGTSRIVIAALLGFIVGFGVGRWDRTSVQTVKDSAGAGGKPVAGKNAATGGEAIVATSKAIAVRGRITFQTESGEQRPDRGARVLFMPEKRIGTTKLPVTGFRATDADTAADAQVAAAGLRALGGDVVFVDDAGNFESSKLQAGTYRILALSHFQPRDDSVTIESEVKGLLDSYFDKPEQLLGKCRYQIDSVKVSGNEPASWDHVFKRE